MFQSLIGMLKTPKRFPQGFQIVWVSIPHRYAENVNLIYSFMPTILVSIPHRYAENYFFIIGLWPNFPVSIPHRYAEN